MYLSIMSDMNVLTKGSSVSEEFELDELAELFEKTSEKKRKRL